MQEILSDFSHIGRGKKAAQIRSIFEQLDQKIWNGIENEEMEQMYLTLEKIHRNLQKD